MIRATRLNREPEREALPPCALPAESTGDRKSVRERILGAALDIVQSTGAQGITQARVAAAAGVRQSHLTYYFPTRADLIKATASAIRDEMVETTNAALLIHEHASDPRAALRHFCMQEVTEAPKARLMLSLMVAAEEESSLREWIYVFDREVIVLWQNIFRLVGLDAQEADIDVFHATFVGAALIGAQSATKASLERAARVVGQAFDLLARACGQG